MAESSRVIGRQKPTVDYYFSDSLLVCTDIEQQIYSHVSGLWLACSACQKGLYLAIYYGQVDQCYQSAVFAPNARFTWFPAVHLYLARLRVPITNQEQLKIATSITSKGNQSHSFVCSREWTAGCCAGEKSELSSRCRFVISDRDQAKTRQLPDISDARA